eukprot:13655538-Ditylum_brightwellii.AAC.1
MDQALLLQWSFPALSLLAHFLHESGHKFQKGLCNAVDRSGLTYILLLLDYMYWICHWMRQRHPTI